MYRVLPDPNDKLYKLNNNKQGAWNEIASVSKLNDNVPNNKINLFF